MDRKIQEKSYRPMHNDIIDIKDIAEQISNGLRQAFGHNPSAVKSISNLIRCNPRAARNWFEGENAPGVVHLIVMMREIPEIYDVIFGLVGGMEKNQINPKELGRLRDASDVLNKLIGEMKLDDINDRRSCVGRR